MATGPKRHELLKTNSNYTIWTEQNIIFKFRNSLFILHIVTSVMRKTEQKKRFKNSENTTIIENYEVLCKDQRLTERNSGSTLKILL